MNLHEFILYLYISLYRLLQMIFNALYKSEWRFFSKNQEKVILNIWTIQQLSSENFCDIT